MNILDLSNPADRNLGRILRLQAEQIPDSPCYRVDDRSYSFGEVNREVNRFAAGLAALGVNQGDRVAIFMRGCVEFIFTAFAANKLGAVWVPINGDYKGRWLAEAIADSKPKVVISDSDKLPRLLEALSLEACGQLVAKRIDQATLPPGVQDLASFSQQPDSKPSPREIHYGDTSAILWTSGTTGKSKGVLQPHNVWINSAESIHRLFGTREDDVIYNCLPLYNTAAWVTSIYRALIVGVPCALDEHFSASHFWQRIDHYRATETTTLGAMHMFLWNAPATESDAHHSLRKANVIPLPPALVAPFMQRFGLEKLQKGYGQSEANPIMVCMEDGQRRWKPNCLGEVAPGLELVLLDEHGHEVPPGSPGEFCIRPSAPYLIFNGYFDNPEATAGAYHGEWYRTGDLGMRDQDGDVFFLDRKSDFIRFKGRNISSLQVEAAALGHPAIAAVACFGIPSDELDSEAEIKLDVVLKPGASLSAEALARHINDGAPYFFVPRYIEFVDELPYTPTNKVQKFKLRQKGLSGPVWDRNKTDFKLHK